MRQTVGHVRSLPVVNKGDLLAEGRTSEVYSYGPGLVVKVLRASVPASWAELEARLTEAVHGCDVPAPRVEGVVEVEGRPGIVFERVDGPSMWDRMLATPNDVPALVREFLSVQSQIRCSGLPIGLPDYVERLCGKIADAGGLSEQERSDATTLARSLPRGAALLHGDFHPANILMGKHGPVVIDWFDAGIGHPIADVVRSSILFRPPSVGEVLHLPRSNPDILERIHQEYRRGAEKLLSDSTADLWGWEAVSAVGRSAEQAQEDEQSLVDLWRSVRNIQTPSPFLDLALSA